MRGLSTGRHQAMNNLGQTGSMMRLLMDQSFSHSCSVTFLEAPWLRMNSFSASSCRPLLNTPCR